jgi:uncharacterized membrane protein
MSKLEYLDALKRAMTGLPPETVAKTLAYYEQRFIDGVMAGRSEADVLKELDEPRKIAMTLRANVHLSAFEQKKNPASLARMLVSVIGLAIFNLFMVIPAMVYGALLVTVYACALSFYIGGIALTASGLSGQNEVALEGPMRQFLSYVDQDIGGDDGEPTEWRMAIDKMGFQIYKEASAPPTGDDQRGAGKLLNRAESFANSDIKITTDFDGGARTSQTLVGLGLVLGGIVLCLISLVVTRFTVVGVRRYVVMNVALVRGR